MQVSGVSREMLLLSNAVEMEDSCWEMRLRCGRIFFVLLLSLNVAILNLRLFLNLPYQFYNS